MIIKRNIRVENLSQPLIDKWIGDKSNLLFHLRFIPGTTEGIVLRKGDVLVGYIAWEGSMITGLYINPEYRKQGLGSWLIDRSEATKLTVNKSRKDAIKLYSNLGFKVIIDSPKMLLMERK